MFHQTLDCGRNSRHRTAWHRYGRTSRQNMWHHHMGEHWGIVRPRIGMSVRILCGCESPRNRSHWSSRNIRYPLHTHKCLFESNAICNHIFDYLITWLLEWKITWVDYLSRKYHGQHVVRSWFNFSSIKMAFKHMMYYIIDFYTAVPGQYRYLFHAIMLCL